VTVFWLPEQRICPAPIRGDAVHCAVATAAFLTETGPASRHRDEVDKTEMQVSAAPFLLACRKVLSVLFSVNWEAMRGNWPIMASPINHEGMMGERYFPPRIAAALRRGSEDSTSNGRTA